jgi:hypothetical protein
MKKNTARLFPLAVLLLALAAAPSFAGPPGGLVGEEAWEELLRGGVLSEARFGRAEPAMAPDYAPLRSILERSGAAVRPGVLVESLYLYKKPATFGAAAWTMAEKTAVLNALVSLSTLAGTQYYSNSRGRMRTFYETSAVINDPLGKAALPDPVFSPEKPLPANLTLYARQKDLSFGDNVYRYDYFIDGDSVIFTQTNCTALSYGIIPLAAKEKLISIAAVIDAGEYFLIYAASMAKAPSVPGLSKKAGDSFSARAEALIKWFISRITAPDAFR